MIKVAVRAVGEVRVAKDASEVGGCTGLLLKSCAGVKEGVTMMGQCMLTLQSTV